MRVLDVFGKSGRVDVVLPYATARWEGKLEGQPASVRRRGFMDPKVRFAVNLIGSPAQRCDDYRRLRINTIVGTAVEVTIPVGDYNDDRLLNLGDNCWVVKPQFGVMHNWEKWSAEVTASAWFYGDNDDFIQDTELERDALYGLQGHLI